jgi:hypothetical protein
MKNGGVVIARGKITADLPLPARQGLRGRREMKLGINRTGLSRDAKGAKIFALLWPLCG